MKLLEAHRELVLFDGVCNLCTASVKFILKWEKNPNLKFTSLQSPDGILLLAELKTRGLAMDSILLVKEGRMLTYSTAALNICWYLKFPFSMGVIFLLVPRFIRDSVYKLIAANRYAMFGKKNTCMVPNEDIRHRFLD